tara:strand:+ start:17327 stop:17518 length:192 start_codon:yes stop_codon:yes gene_type:complete
MDAKVVFSVANSLPEKEFVSLYLLMKEKMNDDNNIVSKSRFNPPISKKEAIEYLINNVFSRKI